MMKNNLRTKKILGKLVIYFCKNFRINRRNQDPFPLVTFNASLDFEGKPQQRLICKKKVNEEFGIVLFLASTHCRNENRFNPHPILFRHFYFIQLNFVNFGADPDLIREIWFAWERGQKRFLRGVSRLAAGIREIVARVRRHTMKESRI